MHTAAKSMLRVMIHGLAAALGLWLALDLLRTLAAGEIEPGRWLVDLRALPQAVRWLVLAGAVVALAMIASGRKTAGWWTALLLLPLLAALLVNTAHFYRLCWTSAIRGTALPLTLFFAAAVLVLMVPLRPPAGRRGWRQLWIVPAAGGWLVVLALGQMVLFGRTDYRRPADAIVVFGARTYADGRLSDALRDRMATGCELYVRGYAPLLILSGGPGDGAIHETEAMRQFTLSAGVPSEAIICDPDGLNTAATARNAARLLERPNGSHGCLLAVSHAYHLPRVKLSFQREGLTAYTVPARERYLLTKMPLLMAREVVAWWAYYLAPASALCD